MIANARVRGSGCVSGMVDARDSGGCVVDDWTANKRYNGGCLNATADLMVGDTVDTVETVQDTHGFHEVLMTVLW